MDGGWPESPPPVRPEHRSLWVALVWLSAGVECGLHACHLFAELPPGGSLSSGQLAEFFDLPAPYFSKHLQALSKAGIAVASPGPRGGYRLARLADEVTVLEVVEAIEGPAAAFRFLEIRQRGRAALPARTYRHPCAIAAAMGKAEAAWRQELKRVTWSGVRARGRRPAATEGRRNQAQMMRREPEARPEVSAARSERLPGR
jgi:Rrf2 family protein